jgi:hypothetical protein
LQKFAEFAEVKKNKNGVTKYKEMILLLLLLLLLMSLIIIVIINQQQASWRRVKVWWV